MGIVTMIITIYCYFASFAFAKAKVAMASNSKRTTLASHSDSWWLVVMAVSYKLYQ
jgi:hypothetical protein